MILALVIFAVTYLLMLALPKERPWWPCAVRRCSWHWDSWACMIFALGGAGAVDYNVLLMMSGTMGIVSLFIRSRMPARLAEQLIVRVPNAQWAVCVLALLPGHQCICGQCGHSAHGGTGGPGHCPQAEDLVGSGDHCHCGVLQPAGRSHAGGGYHQHPAGRLCGDELLDFSGCTAARASSGVWSWAR